MVVGVPVLKHIRVIRVQYFFGMDGWITYDFTSFLTVFQSYQDDDERLCAMELRLWVKRFHLE